jgi:hypothetical protein
MATRSGTPARTGIRGRYLSGPRPRILARIDKRQFPRRVGLYPYRQHKGRKLVLGDRTEALVYILAHELRHMHQQYGYTGHSSFPVGRVKNARGRCSEVCTEAYAIHKLRARRRANGA